MNIEQIWERVRDPADPAAIVEMRAQQDGLSLHIERLTPAIFAVISPDGANHYVCAPQTQNRLTRVVLTHKRGRTKDETTVRVENERDSGPKEIDTLSITTSEPVFLEVLSKSACLLRVGEAAYTFAKSARRGPAMLITDRHISQIPQGRRR